MVYHNNNAHVFSLNLSKAKQQFYNLKNRFSNQKAKSKKATRSSSGSCEAKQAEVKLKKKTISELACFVILRLKENTVSNLPNTNVANEINTNNDGMNEAKDNFSDCSRKSLFFSVSNNQSFETLWQRHCKVEKRKEEVKQAPEKNKQGARDYGRL